MFKRGVLVLYIYCGFKKKKVRKKVKANKKRVTVIVCLTEDSRVKLKLPSKLQSVKCYSWNNCDIVRCEDSHSACCAVASYFLMNCHGMDLKQRTEPAVPATEKSNMKIN